MKRLSTFEKDLQAAKDGDGVEVLTKRRAEIKSLEEKLIWCRNGFRAQCIQQEIDRKMIEYNKIDSLF